MDGTTAGSLGGIVPAPQPATPASASRVAVDRTVAAPVSPTPSQFSQVTPVYAPGPTNTVSDIPQPAVKGIEFVQTPTSLPPPAPIATPVSAPIVTTAPPALIASPPAAQLIQPILPPVMPPVITPPMPTPAADNMSYGQDHSASSGAVNYSAIENQLEDLDLDQVVGAVPATPNPITPESVFVPSPTGAASVEPTSSAPVQAQPTSQQDPAKSYFENAYQVIADTPTTSKPSRLNLNPVLVRRVLIIAGIVIVLGVGGYFAVSAILGSRNSAQPASPSPAITQPTFTQPTTTTTDTTTPATTTPATTTAPSATTTTPTPDTTTTAPAATIAPTPAASSPAPSTTSAPTTPVVSNTGLQW